ncbi:MAG TPA: DUF2442 domain-containing protein [Tepidisphaeraceae bacterium]|jgi:hypothetical protein|nr:DUF2442 domain-containing protein [Tepidisphaeraceae bacterium]
MTTSVTKAAEGRVPKKSGLPRATYVLVSDTLLTVKLTDGRSISVPLKWYPRLTRATPGERNHWELNGRGVGIHWPDLDEDVSVEGLIAGRRSMESAKSFKRWLGQRARGERPTLERWADELGKK